MPSKRSRTHRWGDGCSPTLREHSKAKHEVLSEYIRTYLSIVCQPRKVESFNVTLVDGFSGGGVYDDGKKGSPLVMIDAVCKAIFDINLHRKKHVNISPHYFFVELDPLNYESLAGSLRAGYSRSDNVFTINGDFNAHAHHIIDHIKKRNPRGGGGAIFFLDQDGYSDVHIDTLRAIRRELPKAEIIININVSWLIDFIDDSDRFRNTISNMGLSRYVDVDEIISIKQDVEDSRYIIEAKLSKGLQSASGFPYFRPFFIEPEDNHRGYWLLHLSPHYRAHNAMSEVIWKKGNFMRHYGGDGARIFDLSYKGGISGLPDVFGDTFNKRSMEEHLDGLVRDMPEVLWSAPQTKVADLIEATCNDSAASRDMYIESISRMRNDGEIIVLGKSGGKKRGPNILPADIIIPNRQILLL